MDANKVAIIIYVVVSLITIGVLLFFLIRCEHKTRDGYCICSHGSGMRKTICQGDQTKAYNAGKNEFQDFAKIQREHGGPGWNKVSPGDPDYPVYQGCAETNVMLKNVL